MTRIKTEHAGYEIAYHEHADTWHCYDLDMQAERLGKLKEKINKHCADLRRLPTLKVLEVSGSSWNRGVDRCEITGRVMDDPKSVWIVHRKKNSVSRRKVSLSNLALDTPDVHALILAALDADKVVKSAEAAAREAWEAIPRLDAPNALDNAAKLILDAQDQIAAETEGATA